MISVTINGKPVEVEEGETIIAVAAANDVYLPSLCNHPDLPPFENLPPAPQVFRGETRHENEPPSDNESSIAPLEGCGLCVVEIAGRDGPVRACRTLVEAGMCIQAESETLTAIRREKLAGILARHPHACLTCAQREGCSLEDCSSNVPKEERCCTQFHNCELRKVAECVGIREDTPRYRSAQLPVLKNEPLFTRDFNLCIDCARCVRVCNQVRGVEALGLVYVGGRLVVGSIAPTLMESACKFCGACVEVCPTGCLTDSKPQTGAQEDWFVPCTHTCAAHVDVPSYIRHIAAGDFEGAAAVVWEKLPLANTLGHICFHLCEHECRRGQLDEPIAICALKRFAMAADNGVLLDKVASVPDSGRKVAIVGGGPAGLAAAFYLRWKGHAVTIFEAKPTLGGMPSSSIPDYRLPSKVLEKDIAIIRKMGVEVRTDCRLDTAEAMTGLLDQGFDAALVAVGLPKSKKILLAGSELNGVHWGLEFLETAKGLSQNGMSQAQQHSCGTAVSAVGTQARHLCHSSEAEFKSGTTFDLGKRVIVVGGGNVAIDVAMTALRLAARVGTTTQHGKDTGQRVDPCHPGARPSVRLFCLESREEMPAHDFEIERAEEEGVEINAGWGPVAIRGKQGGVEAVEFQRCLSVFDEQRRFCPTFDEQQRTRAAADTVILAIGQVAPEGVPMEQEGVFLAGDISGVTAAGGSAIQAVASGRAAAERIDRYLGGDGIISFSLGDHPAPNPRIGRDEGFAPKPRIAPPVADPEERCGDFQTIERTYAPDAAIAEAKRCLQCDLRLQIQRPALPPEKWIPFDRTGVVQVPAVEGVLVLSDADRRPVLIKGAEDIHAALLERLESSAEASFFLWEEDRMFTKRESELIQQHLKQYGEMPGGGDDELDDLF